MHVHIYGFPTDVLTIIPDNIIIALLSCRIHKLWVGLQRTTEQLARLCLHINAILVKPNVLDFSIV